MKIYKDKQFLVFDFEDGNTVKYDFATKTSIGKRGKPVKNLCSQLNGLTIDQLCNCCVDKQYGNFLRFIKDRNDCHICNIGTILSKVPNYARYEQIFSAGIDGIVDGNFKYTINDIPKALIKLCKEHNLKISNNFLELYKQNPDTYQAAYKFKLDSLTPNNITTILTYSCNVKEQWGEMNWQYRWKNVSAFSILIKDYGYTAKGLLSYIDYLKTYEALEDVMFTLREIYDYATMMAKISPKFDKYPRHFLTTHKIASRNYNRLKQQFYENDFKKRITEDMERTFGEYRFYYPKCTQDIKDEAVAQNNCVASYIQKVIDGECHILFLRKKESPNESLVTIEVRDNEIVQARRKFNYPVTQEQQEVINRWNKWWSNKINNINDSESEETQNVD